MKLSRNKRLENRKALDKPVVGELFDKQLSSSASRLGIFAECPYRHFSRYILGLNKREEFKLEPPDLGEFYHRTSNNAHQKKRINGDFADFP